MHNDIKLFKWAALLLAMPLALAFFGHDQFRYPCQDPQNWDTAQCKKPACDVTRTCPEHIFKGQRDPRTLTDDIKPAAEVIAQKGNSCAK